MMGVAQTVQAIIGQIGLPEVMDQPAAKAWQDVELVHGNASAFFVDAVEGETLGAGDVCGSQTQKSLGRVRSVHSL